MRELLIALGSKHNGEEDQPRKQSEQQLPIRPVFFLLVRDICVTPFHALPFVLRERDSASSRNPNIGWPHCSHSR